MDFLGNMEQAWTKTRKRQTLAENRYAGRVGEASVKMKYALDGYEVERTGRGSDYKAKPSRLLDAINGTRRETKLIEVKTGNAKLSPLQRKTKRKSNNYVVERTSGWL